MVLPLSYFINTPFQNWTRDNASLIGVAYLYVDYEAPIERLRVKLEAIAHADLIVLGPGSLYTSLLPNLLVPELVEAIRRSRAGLAYHSSER